MRQNQPKIMLYIKGNFLEHKYQGLGIFVTRLKCIIDLIQQYLIFWYLFNFSIKEVSSLDVALRYLPLKATGKKFRKKKLYFMFLIDFQFKTLVMQQ